MNEFLSSVKADLLDRRLLPLGGVALTALVAALAYVVLGGGSGSSSTSSPAAPASPASPGISVSAVETGAQKAIAETTDGVKQQRNGSARNPFAPLPGAASAASSAPSVSAGSSSTSGGASQESSSGSGSGEASGGSEETKQPGKTPKKAPASYRVTVKFGSLAPDPVTGEVELETFVNLKLFTKLPNGKQPLLVFRGVTAGGKAAVFTVVGEAILSGTGACQPSALQCKAVDLKPGESEKLEYLPSATSPVVSYELRVVSIHQAQAKAKSARAAHLAEVGGWGKSQAGWEVLWKHGLLAIPGMHQSSQAGVLLFGSGQKHARAHASRHGPRLGR